MMLGGREKQGRAPSAAMASAVFYGVSSLSIMAVNKIVLTGYAFPSASVVALFQMLLTITILPIAKHFGVIEYPDISTDVVRKVFPLPLLYLANLVTGLGGTQRINLPMFTLLRRFSILMTMILEGILLGTKAPSIVKFSVALMLGGALVAASNDLAFDMHGYILILMNDLFTALNGVYLKRKLDSKDLGSFGLMFYNCLLSLPILLLAVGADTNTLLKLQDFEYWGDFVFLLYFFASCIMGVVLTYSIFVCTHHNSALTTTVVGCLKNVLVAYLGMLMSDYIFSWTNFLGINISIFGSLVYSYAKYKPSGTKPRELAVSSATHEGKSPPSDLPAPPPPPPPAAAAASSGGTKGMYAEQLYMGGSGGGSVQGSSHDSRSSSHGGSAFGSIHGGAADGVAGGGSKGHPASHHSSVSADDYRR